MTHPNWGETKAEVGSFLKNPALGNSASGGMALALSVLFFNPNLIASSHEHDIEKVQAVVTATVEIANLRTFIRQAAEEVDKYSRKIDFEICLQTGCAYEKSEMNAAQRKQASLEKELALAVKQK